MSIVVAVAVVIGSSSKREISRVDPGVQGVGGEKGRERNKKGFTYDC